MARIKRTPEKFRQLFGDMKNQKALQDAVAAYYELLNNVSAMTIVPPDGSRLRDVYIHDQMQVLYNNGNYDVSFPNQVTRKPKPVASKSTIWAVPVPIADHYITSLKQGIGNNVPRPELRRVDESVTDPEKDGRLFQIAQLLQRLLVNKLKNGSDNHSMRLLDKLQEQGMAYGLAGLRLGKWYPKKGDPPELTIDFVPYHAILLSDSGRYLAVMLEVFKGDSDMSEYKFKNNPFSPDETDEASREYYELYDIDQRVTYFVSASDFEEVKKAEDWPIGLDNPPIVLFMTGSSNGGTPYSTGMLERWLPIWEEIVIAISMLCYYSKLSGQAKLLVSGLLADDPEDIEELKSFDKWLVNLKALGMTNGLGDGQKIQDVLMPYKPIDSIQEWANWLGELRRMLAEYQYFPDISRGVANPTTSYMKAGTAQTLDQTRARLVNEVALSFSNMLERLYKEMLDFLGANPDIVSVRQFLKDEQTVAMLRQDYDISVSIGDIQMTAEQQDAQKMQGLIQASPMLMQTLTMLGQAAQMQGMQLDTLALSSDFFGKALGIPMNKYLKPMAPMPVQAGMGAPPMMGGGGSAPAPGPAAPSGGSSGADWLLNKLYQVGREDLISVLNEVNPQIQEQLGLVASSLDPVGFREFLSELEGALGAGDVEGELTALLGRYSNG